MEKILDTIGNFWNRRTEQNITSTSNRPKQTQSMPVLTSRNIPEFVIPKRMSEHTSAACKLNDNAEVNLFPGWPLSPRKRLRPPLRIPTINDALPECEEEQGSSPFVFQTIKKDTTREGSVCVDDDFPENNSDSRRKDAPQLTADSCKTNSNYFLFPDLNKSPRLLQNNIQDKRLSKASFEVRQGSMNNLCGSPLQKPTKRTSLDDRDISVLVPSPLSRDISPCSVSPRSGNLSSSRTSRASRSSYTDRAVTDYDVLTSQCFKYDSQDLDNEPDFFRNKGEIELTIQYCTELKQLRIRILRVQHLGRDQGCMSKSIKYTNVKVYLSPRRADQRTSHAVKGYGNPVFDEAFFFGGYTVDELECRNLRIQVLKQGGLFHGTICLGEVNIQLNRYDLLEHSRVWYYLKDTKERQNNGCLKVALIFIPREEMLIITVLQAKYLDEYSTNGAPDVYVKIGVFQCGVSLTSFRTRTVFNTSSPLFGESFRANISPKFKDLPSTSVNIEVYRKRKFFKDELLGCVCIGGSSSENSVLLQWRNTVVNPEQEFILWHYL